MACNAISYQTARIEDSTLTKLLAGIDKDSLTQKLLTFLKVACPDARAYERTPTTVSAGAFLYTAQGTVEIVVWNERGIEVRTNSTVLAEAVKARITPFFAALAAQQLQAQVAGWARANATVTKAETLPNGAFSLKVRI